MTQWLQGRDEGRGPAELCGLLGTTFPLCLLHCVLRPGLWKGWLAPAAAHTICHTCSTHACLLRDLTLTSSILQFGSKHQTRGVPTAVHSPGAGTFPSSAFIAIIVLHPLMRLCAVHLLGCKPCEGRGCDFADLCIPGTQPGANYRVCSDDCLAN